MRVSVTTPIMNEAPWVGYSILACLDQMHQFIYALDEKSDDGTRELLYHIKDKYAHEKLIIIEHPNFHPHDMKAYNNAFNVCIAQATGDAVFFLHPDMLIENAEALLTMPADALAWWTNVTSYSGDFQTVITQGRCDKWKNIHARKFGVHYYGGYGSQNEDFYHSDITGKAYHHYGTDFTKYPYTVKDSGLRISHFCELKGYRRRLEKMKLCLKTLIPTATDDAIDEMAKHHPRVTLESSSNRFGKFEFTKDESLKVPAVIEKYRDEFESFTKEPICA